MNALPHVTNARCRVNPKHGGEGVTQDTCTEKKEAKVDQHWSESDE